MASLICPRCEKPMDSHVDGECQGKKLSRRFFLGALGSAFAGAALAKALPNYEAVVDPAAGPDSTVISVFKPKVHEGGSIRLTLSGFTDLEYFRAGEYYARQSNRPVIVTDREGNVKVALDPNTPQGNLGVRK